MPNIARLDQNFSWDSSPLQKELRRLMAVLEPRFGALENQIVDWEAAVENLTNVGLSRIDDVLTPSLETIQEAANLGFLVAQAEDQVNDMVVGQERDWVVTSEGKELFKPTAYILIQDDADEDNWGIGEFLSYLPDTGELALQIVYAATSQVAGSDWTFSCNSAVLPAMQDLLAAAVVAKDAAEAAMATTAAQVAILEDLIEVIEEGAVVSVAGKTGIVTLAIADIVGLVTALATKADTSYVNTQVGSEQDASAKLSALAEVTWAADQFSYHTGTSSVATTVLSAFARTLLDDADQAAAQATLGIPSAASDANIRSATGAGFVSAAAIESASATVTLTDATTIALNWDTGINFGVTLAANRILGNPTNGQPGTTRTVLLKGDSTTDRIITFGNQYLGTVPTITDIDSGRWYLLTIFCITASHFAVTSQKVYGT